jgi:hypothetical protein
MHQRMDDQMDERIDEREISYMWGDGTRLDGELPFRAGMRAVTESRVTEFRFFASVVTALIVAVALLASPEMVLAQHGGGGGHGMGSGTGVGTGRPDGVSDKDDLKDFHRAMAVQATDEQRAAFAKIAQYAQAASDQLGAFRESVRKGATTPTLPDRGAALDQAIAKARASNESFVTSFFAAQKSGLKDFTTKLGKAEGEVDKQIKALDQMVLAAKPEAEQVVNTTASLEKEFATFESEQLALGREMGILLSSDNQGLAFNIPKVTNSISFGSQTISIPATAVASETSSANGRNVFSVKLTADLSDVQQNLTGALRAKLDRSPRCGERVQIRQATLTPLTPASLVVAQLHLERWICPPGQFPVEAASNDGRVEVKITPSVDPNLSLHLTPEITRVDAEGLLRDLLRSGDLGAEIREQIAALLLAALQRTADLKTALPPVAQQSATLQSAEFQDAGADQLNLVLEGKMEFSDEQTKQFALQLKQHLSAQGTPTP